MSEAEEDIGLMQTFHDAIHNEAVGRPVRQDEIEKLRAEITRLRRAIVWMAERGVFIAPGWPDHRKRLGTRNERPEMNSILYDGTDDSLIETVCKLSEEGK